MSSIILSHLRSNRRCLQMSINLTINCFKRLQSRDVKSFDAKSFSKTNEWLHYYPMISNINNTINEIDLKKDSILDKLDSNHKYIVSTSSQTHAINPILVPNLSQFWIINKNESKDIDWDRNGTADKTDGHKEPPVVMRLDFIRKRDPRAYTHLTVIRRRKMSKHKRRKWRKKMLAFLKKKFLRRNIKKEKVFRAELLAQIKEAEDFDAEKYVSDILQTIDSMPKEETRKEKLEKINDLIRKNRRETNLIPPKFQD